jgi:hypothetical protein
MNGCDELGCNGTVKCRSRVKYSCPILSGQCLKFKQLKCELIVNSFK